MLPLRLRAGGIAEPPLDRDAPAVRAFQAVMGEASKVLFRAKQALAKGDEATAERESERYLLLVEGLDAEGLRWMVGVDARRILAEVYVRQGRFAQALESSQEVSKWGTAGLSARQSAVKALALIGLSRLDEARVTLERTLKTDNVPVSLLGDRADLPWTRDPSASALAATAWLVHAVEPGEDGRSALVAQRDYEAARRLAPRNPAVALNAARFYRVSMKRPDLAQGVLAAVSGGSKGTSDLIASERAEATALDAQIAAAKTPQGP